jgi:hypothetical protein
MFPTVCLAYVGRDLLTPRPGLDPRAWRTTRQIRGDTENHSSMYYTSLYLMAELYPERAGRDSGTPASPPRRTSPRPRPT